MQRRIWDTGRRATKVQIPEGIWNLPVATRVTVELVIDNDLPPADEDEPIHMLHLVRAVAQEYAKQGRLTLEADFERFSDLIWTKGNAGV